MRSRHSRARPFTMHDFRFTRVRLEGGRAALRRRGRSGQATRCLEPSSTALVSAAASHFFRRDKLRAGCVSNAGFARSQRRSFYRGRGRFHLADRLASDRPVLPTAGATSKTRGGTTVENALGYATPTLVFKKRPLPTSLSPFEDASQLNHYWDPLRDGAVGRGWRPYRGAAARCARFSFARGCFGGAVLCGLSQQREEKGGSGS